MKAESTLSKIPRSDTLRRRLNVILIRVAHIDVENKQPEEISLAEVFGNMDAWDYLILLLSLVVTLIVGTFLGIVLLTIWPRPVLTLVLICVGTPAVFSGFVICYCLFRIKHWLALGE